MDPRGFPTTLPEFQRVFPDDRACAAYLESLRWMTGSPARRAASSGSRTDSRRVLACSGAAHVGRMSRSRPGLSYSRATRRSPCGSRAAYLMATQTPGQSATQFQRQLGLSRYETAWQESSTSSAPGMVRPERDTIGGEHHRRRWTRRLSVDAPRARAEGSTTNATCSAP